MSQNLSKRTKKKRKSKKGYSLSLEELRSILSSKPNYPITMFKEKTFSKPQKSITKEIHRSKARKQQAKTRKRENDYIESLKQGIGIVRNKNEVLKKDISMMEETLYNNNNILKYLNTTDQFIDLDLPVINIDFLEHWNKFFSQWESSFSIPSE